MRTTSKSILAAAAILFSGAARAEAPVPAPSPAAVESPAATPAPVTDEPVTVDLAAGRVTFSDGMRDGRNAAEHSGFFCAKKPAVTGESEYVRGYDRGFHDVARHRHTNTAVGAGFALVLIGLAGVAFAQSQGGNSGAIEPAGFRF